MKSSTIIGLVFISIFLVFSVGAVFADVSKDKVNAANPNNITNTTRNITNSGSFKNPIEIRPVNTTKNFTINASTNMTNETMPLNATKNITNPFKEGQRAIIAVN